MLKKFSPSCSVNLVMQTQRAPTKQYNPFNYETLQGIYT